MVRMTYLIFRIINRILFQIEIIVIWNAICFDKLRPGRKIVSITSDDLGESANLCHACLHGRVICEYGEYMWHPEINLKPDFSAVFGMF